MKDTPKRSSLSVIVPVYNSQDVIEDLVNELEKELRLLTDEFELILVNDASIDRSWNIIRLVAEKKSWVRGINLMRNFGQHNALLCGIRAARFDVIVTMDDDMQHPPVGIASLLNELNEGYDVVYGSPQKDNHGIWRNIASYVTKLALKTAMGIETARKVSAFRAFRSNLRNAFSNYHSPFVSIDVLLTWGTDRFSSVPVRHEPSRRRTSNYTFRKLVNHAINMMTGFSVLPLQFASVIGFGFTMFGIAVFIYVIGRYLIEGGSVPGFPFLASIISIFSGAQLLVLGIIGEYLARVHFRTMEKPPYSVRDYVNYQ
jgi:glycosyltransferase involved in cell wall biosynthesis